MPTFIYKARDQKSLPIVGAVEAPDEITVAQNLRRLGYRVITIKRESHLKTFLSDLWSKRTRKPRQEELIFFTRQLQTMAKSGIPIVSALSSVGEQTRNKLLKETINATRQDIEKGMSLSESLSKHPDTFSESFVSMIRVGEAAGILDDVLERLHQLAAQELEVTTRIKSAFAYPIILVTLALLVVSFLLINILPKFILVFETYEAKLPLATRMLLGISFLVRHLWYVVAACLVGFIFWFRGYVRSEKGKYQFHSYLLKMPLFGQLYLKIVISRFSRTLGAMTKTGVPILEALSVSEKTIPNIVIRKIIQKIRFAITEGESLVEPFKASGIFPSMVIQMISAGEKTGKLDQMLIDIADFYDRETEYTIRNITTILEPALLLTMGLTVAFIALSVLLPIFNLIKVFRH